MTAFSMVVKSVASAAAESAFETLNFSEGLAANTARFLLGVSHTPAATPEPVFHPSLLEGTKALSAAEVYQSVLIARHAQTVGNPPPIIVAFNGESGLLYAKGIADEQGVKLTLQLADGQKLPTISRALDQKEAFYRTTVALEQIQFFATELAFLVGSKQLSKTSSQLVPESTGLSIQENSVRQLFNYPGGGSFKMTSEPLKEIAADEERQVLDFGTLWELAPDKGSESSRDTIVTVYHESGIPYFARATKGDSANLLELCFINGRTQAIAIGDSTDHELTELAGIAVDGPEYLTFRAFCAGYQAGVVSRSSSG